MQKLSLKGFRHFGVFLAICVVFSLPSGNPIEARESVPFPQRKPASPLHADAHIVKYSFKDITKSLLDFSGEDVPLPTHKPAYDDDIALSTADINRYRRIFELQAQGQIEEADEQLEKLGNLSLRGHVLYQRYMHPNAYESNFEELRKWLALYGDYPGADRIYKLALRKKPQNFSGKIPAYTRLKGTPIVDDPMMYPAKNAKAVHGARQAASHLYNGQVGKAQAIAFKATKNLEEKAPQAAWVHGLALWVEQDYRRSAKSFEVVARSDYASGWLRAAGAYWAARSHMRSGNVASVSKWLKQAAKYPRSFYGLMATRALEHDFAFDWHVPAFKAEHEDILANVAAGARALSLMKVGQKHRAESELMSIDAGRDSKLRAALLAFAAEKGMPALALRLGAYSSKIQSKTYDSALYPLGEWRIDTSLSGVNPALIHAVIRQESRFNPYAKSASGAKGLMQIMPSTAKAVARGGQYNLLNPDENLEIGYKYISHLLKDRSVDGDLISLLIAYNAGPGNLARWKSRWANIDDPLLFIELIPSGETRTYVERVLANYWIYKMRDGDVPETMDALVEGRTARYADDQTGQHPFQLASK